MSEGFGLKRVLGLGDLVAIEVGTTIGAGIFSLTALAAKMTGPAVPLAFLAAAVNISFTMMTVGMLGAALPTVGGTYRYPSRLFSPVWAAVGVWCYALGLVFGGFPMYATECVHYLMGQWPWIPDKAASVALLTVFYLINVFGIELAASAQAVMVGLLILALLVFGVLGVPHLEPARFTPLFTGGLGGFVLASCILTFALQGSNSVIELGAEIKRPSRNIPLSMAISVPVVTVLYILIAVSALGVIDLKEWLAFGDQANLTQPAHKFLGSGLFLFFLIGGAVFAFTTTLNGTFMWATKSLMVVAKDGLIPATLARTSRRGVPVLFLTVLWALSVLAVILNAGLQIFATLATIGGMMICIPAMIAAIRLPSRLPEDISTKVFRLRGPLLYIAPVISIITSLLLIVILFADLAQKSIVYPALFVVWFILGLVFFHFRRRGLEKKSGGSFKKMIEDDFQAMIVEARAVLNEESDPLKKKNDS